MEGGGTRALFPLPTNKACQVRLDLLVNSFDSSHARRLHAIKLINGFGVPLSEYVVILPSNIKLLS